MSKLKRERTMKPYRTPKNIRIGRDTAAEDKLYTAEDRVHSAIKYAAEAWGAVAKGMRFARNGKPIITEEESRDFYRVLLPQALFDLLNSYDANAAILAAETFLSQESVKRHKAGKVSLADVQEAADHLYDGAED